MTVLKALTPVVTSGGSSSLGLYPLPRSGLSINVGAVENAMQLNFLLELGRAVRIYTVWTVQAALRRRGAFEHRAS